MVRVDNTGAQVVRDPKEVVGSPLPWSDGQAFGGTCRATRFTTPSKIQDQEFKKTFFSFSSFEGTCWHSYNGNPRSSQKFSGVNINMFWSRCFAQIWVKTTKKNKNKHWDLINTASLKPLRYHSLFSSTPIAVRSTRSRSGRDCWS